MTFSQLLDEFQDYLILIKFSPYKNYRSYLRSTYNYNSQTKRLLDKITNENDKLEQLNHCQELLEVIIKNEEKDIANKKKLQNYHSAVKKLFEFVYNTDSIKYYAPKMKKKTIQNSVNRVEVGLAESYSCIDHQEDNPTKNVYYASDVEPQEQIPCLCETIECEYSKVYESAYIFKDFFANCLPEKIKVELRKECPTKTYYNDDEYITNKVNELIEKGKIVSKEEIAKIIRIEMRINGEFVYNKEPYIIIYFNQFNVSCWDEYKSAISNTLAHEFAHYLEYCYCKMHKATPFIDDRVSESIADFFSIIHSINLGDAYDLTICESKYNSWKKYFGSNWPYANSLYFYPIIDRFGKCHLDYNYYIGSGCINKLTDVFSDTTNIAKAYKKLIS